MAYGYYRTLTTDYTKCGTADSPSFPVLVSVNHASMKTVANDAVNGRIQNTCTQVGGAGGTIPADLVFSSDNAGSSKYPWEVESYDAVNGILLAWVQVPTLSYTAGTVFYMVFGDAGVTTQQNTGSFSPANVWDVNYKAVYHLTESAGPYVDSTGNGNNSTGGTAPTQVAGKVGKCQQFNGSTQSIAIPSVLTGLGTGEFTLSCWASITGGSGNVESLLTFYGAGAYGNPMLGYDNYSHAGQYNIDNSTPLAGSVTLYNTGFHHVVFRRGGGNWNNYTDSAADGGGAHTPSTYVAKAGRIGADADLNNYTACKIDEARISAIARSTSWITAEFNNQNAPGNIGAAAFLTFGAETGAGPSFQPAWAGGANQLIGGG